MGRLRKRILAPHVLSDDSPLRAAPIMKYKVSLRKTDEGFSVSCPGLPGCWSQGETEQEVLENIADAIREYLSVAEELATDDDGELREVEIAA